MTLSWGERSVASYLGQRFLLVGGEGAGHEIEWRKNGKD